jgi:hypothetical protein
MGSFGVFVYRQIFASLSTIPLVALFAILGIELFELDGNTLFNHTGALHNFGRKRIGYTFPWVDYIGGLLAGVADSAYLGDSDR